jgi:hypothetical protein
VIGADDGRNNVHALLPHTRTLIHTHTHSRANHHQGLNGGNSLIDYVTASYYGESFFWGGCSGIRLAPPSPQRDRRGRGSRRDFS